MNIGEIKNIIIEQLLTESKLSLDQLKDKMITVNNFWGRRFDDFDAYWVRILDLFKTKLSDKNQKYLNWVLNEYIECINDLGDCNLYMVDKANQLLTTFENNKQRITYDFLMKNSPVGVSLNRNVLDKIKKSPLDIYSYDWIHFNLMFSLLPPSIKDIKSKVNKIYDDENILVIQPLSKEASCYYGANTKWCTSATAEEENRFEHYTSDGNFLFYMIFKPNVNVNENYRKLAFHIDYYDNVEIYNTIDELTDEDELWKIGFKLEEEYRQYDGYVPIVTPELKPVWGSFYSALDKIETIIHR